jgi:hypothetical protein
LRDNRDKEEMRFKGKGKNGQQMLIYSPLLVSVYRCNPHIISLLYRLDGIFSVPAGKGFHFAFDFPSDFAMILCCLQLYFGTDECAVRVLRADGGWDVSKIHNIAIN